MSILEYHTFLRTQILNIEKGTQKLSVLGTGIEVNKATKEKKLPMLCKRLFVNFTSVSLILEKSFKEVHPVG